MLIRVEAVLWSENHDGENCNDKDNETRGNNVTTIRLRLLKMHLTHNFFGIDNNFLKDLFFSEKKN